VEGKKLGRKKMRWQDKILKTNLKSVEGKITLLSKMDFKY